MQISGLHACAIGRFGCRRTLDTVALEYARQDGEDDIVLFALLFRITRCTQQRECGRR